MAIVINGSGTVTDEIETLENGTIQVRTATRVLEDGAEMATDEPVGE